MAQHRLLACVLPVLFQVGANTLHDSLVAVVLKVTYGVVSQVATGVFPVQIVFLVMIVHTVSLRFTITVRSVDDATLR